MTDERKPGTRSQRAEPGGGAQETRITTAIAESPAAQP